jgi:transposase InsO family protein
LGQQRSGEKVNAQDRKTILALVNEGTANGLTQDDSCETVGVGPRTVQRWRLLPILEDGRRGPTTAPGNRLSVEEKARIVAISMSAEFFNKSPHQIVPTLADRGEYVASESSFYRVLKADEVLAHRGKAKPKTVHRPKALEATQPNEVYSWDITYLLSALRGQYFYLYMFLDIFSRKIVGWRVHGSESMDLSSMLLAEICAVEGIDKNQLSLHADNGGPMKGATMLVTMQNLGIMPSFSRPSVSDDNPFSESLFKTLKYCPLYPSKPFASIEEATIWVEVFVAWYNGEHLHSGIKFVTPNSRHDGTDIAILERRDFIYEEAKLKNPLRWSKQTRNWKRIEAVKLNYLKEENKSATTASSRLAS